ncbi:hypothetical protein ACFQAT_28240 [Undibacterium arcticum]|uniref:Uncharacterized protein n=1 Tax=Undibacterium arcticum TaxID=1762892 RepID=A0ABV7F7Q6_9BURK
MLVRLLSDLHLEFEVLPIRRDIGTGTSGIEWAKKTFGCPVIYVACNHEFYSHHFDDLIPELRAAAAGTNVHFLEKGNVRFTGATLWTDFKLY